VFLLALSVLVASDAGSAPVAEAPDWYPVDAGLAWEYAISGTQSLGADTADVSGSMSRRVLGVVRHSAGFPVSMIASSATFTFTPRNAEEPTTAVICDTFYVHATDSLILRYQSLDSPESLRLMVLPLEVGAFWFSHPSVPIKDEVAGLDETVTVPAGTFTGCAHIHEPFTASEAAGSYNDFYFADGVGVVKFILHMEIQDQTDHVVFDLRQGARPTPPEGIAPGGMP
jgi:hypothetical protein